MSVKPLPQSEEEIAIDAFARVVWSAFLTERIQNHGLQTIPCQQGEPSSSDGLCEIPISTSQTNKTRVLSHAMPIQKT